MSNDGDSLDSKTRPRKSKVRVAPKSVRPRRSRGSVAPPATPAPLFERDREHAPESVVPEAPASRITVPPTIVTVAPPELDEHAFFDAPAREAEARRTREEKEPRAESELAEARARVAAMERRRAKLATYVRAAVGVAALLCIAAGVRGAIARVRQDREVPVANAMEAPRAVAAAPAAAPAVAAEAPAATATAEAPAPSEAPPSMSAQDEKKAARIALEHGKLKDAIAAGERSVAADPTDAEAWLLLGAAYQDSGHGADARRCFKECTKQGKTGPIGECRLMLQ